MAPDPNPNPNPNPNPSGQLLATLLALLRRVALLVAKLLMPADVNH